MLFRFTNTKRPTVSKLVYRLSFSKPGQYYLHLRLSCDFQYIKTGNTATKIVLLFPPAGTCPEPFNSTPMGVNPIPSGSPHVRQMVRTC